MAATSPTPSVKLREIIGTEAFSQRREVFDQHETVFLPSPTSTSPTYVEVEPIITSNQGKSLSNFRRTPAYSSMRETRKDDIRNELGFRERKHSDNFTSDLYQNDDVDYRHSMTERTRRLSKLRKDFLTSNLHEPSNTDPFARVGTRASLPLKSPSGRYKIESTTIYKFPFAEPFSTPPPVRRVFLDFGPVEEGESKENKDPEEKTDSPKKHQSLPNDKTIIEVDHHKLFNELVNRYSPQRKPVDWSLPPTKPRIVGALTKPNSLEVDDTLEIKEEMLKIVEENENTTQSVEKDGANFTDEEKIQEEASKRLSNDSKRSNGAHINANGLQKDSSDELDDFEKVPELNSIIKNQINQKSATHKTGPNDDTIPALLQKIENEEPKIQEKKKIKRKRSLLDKLFNRKK